MIAVLNSISIGLLLMTVAVLGFRLFRNRKHDIPGRMALLPFLFLALAVVTNLVEHLGISEIPDNWEDILGILFFPFLIFTLHAAIIKRELKRAEESDRLKSAFLANLSHEIRTPLNGIMGFCELLKDESASPGETREYADLLGVSSARFLRLMDNLILLSRIESEDYEVKKEPFDAGELIGELLSEISIPAEKKGLVIKIDAGSEDGDAIVRTDRASLSIILSHLIDNALKFTDRGGIRVLWNRSGNNVRVVIEDTGKGMTDEEIRNAFERFGRVDTGRESAYEGVGTGLPIARKLARALGGELSVSSTPGKGSAFTVEIPETES